MYSSRREDYLLRQVKAIAEMLARIVGLRTSGANEEARAELERSYSALLGAQNGLVRRVDAVTAATLLGSPAKILAFAQLLDEEATQESDAGRVARLRTRALELAREASRRDPANAEIRRYLKEHA